MKRLGLALVFCLSLIGAAFAQGGMGPGPGTVHSTGGGGCSQATAFLARTTLTGTDATNYTNLICGLETDGVGCSNTLDFLYILAAPDSTTELLNLCSSSFSLTSNGTNTFTAGQGSAGDGTTGFLDTNFTPSTNTVFSTQDSATFGLYSRTSRTGSANVGHGGHGSNFAWTYIVPLFGGNQIQTSINSSNFPNFTSNANAQGAYSSTRTSSSVVALNKNGSSTSLTVSGTQTSTALTNIKLAISAIATTTTPTNFTTDQIAAAWYGAGLTGANAVLLHTRINTFMTAYGTNVY